MQAYQLDRASALRLQDAHPKLRTLVLALAAEGFEFRVLDSLRDQQDQEAAKARGNSKAGWLQSPHNYVPAIAVDLVPLPVKWNDLAPFKDMGARLKRLAAKLSIPISWGGDWRSFKDYPHVELHPWRDFAKNAAPYRK